MTTFPLLLAINLGSTWVLDPAHAQATFTVRHMMVMDVSGTLGKVSGTVEMDDKDVAKSKVEVSIDVDPQTQEAKRDDHLKGPDFFAIDRFPRATFKATKIAKAGKDKLKVTGDLTLRDVTKPVSFDVTLTPEYQSPFTQAPVRAVVATAKISRLDFGLKWQMPMQNNALLVGNDVKIAFNAEMSPPHKNAEEPAADAGTAKPDAGAKK